jgi:flagellar FliL protein
MAQDPPVIDLPPKKSKKKLIIITIIILIVAGAGVGYFMFFEKTNSPKTEVKAEAEKPPIFIPLESFTVNLQPYSDEQYLQIGMTLQTAESAEEELLKLHMPEIRNRIILMLSTKHASDITSDEGKKILANDIIERANTPFTGSKIPQKIKAVFFTSFIIQ